MTFLLLIFAALWPRLATQKDFTVPQPHRPYGTVAATSGAAIFHIKQNGQLSNMEPESAPISEARKYFPPELPIGAKIATRAEQEEQPPQKRHLASITPLPHKETYLAKDRKEEPQLPDGSTIQKAPLWVQHIPSNSRHKFTVGNLGQSEIVMQQFYRGSNGGKPYVTPKPGGESTARKNEIEGREAREIAEKIIKHELNRAKVARFGKSAAVLGYEENSSADAQPALQESGYSGETRALIDWSMNNNNVEEFPNGYDGLSALPVPVVPNSMMTNEVLEEHSTRPPTRPYTITPPVAPPTAQIVTTTTEYTSSTYPYPLSTDSTTLTSSQRSTLPPSHPLCGQPESPTFDSNAASGPTPPPVDGQGPRTVQYPLPKSSISSIDGAVTGRKQGCVPCSGPENATPAASAALAPLAPHPALPVAPAETSGSPPSVPNHIPLNPAPYVQPLTHPGPVPNAIPPSPIPVGPEPPASAERAEMELAPAPAFKPHEEQPPTAPEHLLPAPASLEVVPETPSKSESAAVYEKEGNSDTGSNSFDRTSPAPPASVEPVPAHSSLDLAPAGPQVLPYPAPRTEIINPSTPVELVPSEVKETQVSNPSPAQVDTALAPAPHVIQPARPYQPVTEVGPTPAQPSSLSFPASATEVNNVGAQTSSQSVSSSVKTEPLNPLPQIMQPAQPAPSVLEVKPAPESAEQQGSKHDYKSAESQSVPEPAFIPAPAPAPQETQPTYAPSSSFTNRISEQSSANTGYTAGNSAAAVTAPSSLPPTLAPYHPPQTPVSTPAPALFPPTSSHPPIAAPATSTATSQLVSALSSSSSVETAPSPAVRNNIPASASAEENGRAFVQISPTSAESGHSGPEGGNAELEVPLVPVPVAAPTYKEVEPAEQEANSVVSGEHEPEPPLTNPPTSFEGYQSPSPSTSSFSNYYVNSGSSSTGGSTSSNVATASVPTPVPTIYPSPASSSYTAGSVSSQEFEPEQPSATNVSEESLGGSQYINASPGGPTEQSYRGPSQQIAYVPETAPSLPDREAEETSFESTEPEPKRPESTYSNLEEDHQESQAGPVTIIDTDSNTGNVPQVSQETEREKTYEIPAKITPIQVKPASQYNRVKVSVFSHRPQPKRIQPYVPEPLPTQPPQAVVGYQQQIGPYAPPPQNLQPPPLPFLQPQPLLQPPPPPLQPLPAPATLTFPSTLPSYQAPPPQQQQGCCGGQLFSQQGSLCMPMNFNPCSTQSPLQNSAPCGQCSTCNSACQPPAQETCGGGNCCVMRSPSCCPQQMSSLCCNQVVHSCCQPQQRLCCNAQTSSCCPHMFQGCCCNQSQLSGLCRRSKRSIGRLLGLCGSALS